jgi:hypothetical protein
VDLSAALTTFACRMISVKVLCVSGTWAGAGTLAQAKNAARKNLVFMFVPQGGYSRIITAVLNCQCSGQ